jgi:hypothetical protein
MDWLDAFTAVMAVLVVVLALRDAFQDDPHDQSGGAEK